MRSELTKLSSFLKKSGYYRHSAVVRNLITKYAALAEADAAMYKRIRFEAAGAGDLPSGVKAGVSATFANHDVTDITTGTPTDMATLADHIPTYGYAHSADWSAAPPVVDYLVDSNNMRWQADGADWKRTTTVEAGDTEYMAIYNAKVSHGQERSSQERQEANTASTSIKAIQQSLMDYGAANGSSVEAMSTAMNFWGDGRVGEPNGDWGPSTTNTFANIKTLIPTASDEAAEAMAAASSGDDLEAAAAAVELLSTPVPQAPEAPGGLSALEGNYTLDQVSAYLRGLGDPGPLAEGEAPPDTFFGIAGTGGELEASEASVMRAISDGGQWSPKLDDIHAAMRASGVEPDVSYGEGQAGQGGLEPLETDPEAEREEVRAILNQMTNGGDRLWILNRRGKYVDLPGFNANEFRKEMYANWANAEDKEELLNRVMVSLSGAGNLLGDPAGDPGKSKALVFYALESAVNDTQAKWIMNRVNRWSRDPGSLTASPGKPAESEQSD